jgi:hypothetical protein
VIDEGTERELEWRPEIASSGAVRFVGELGRDVQLPNGRRHLRFVIRDGEELAARQEIEVEVE